MLSMSVQGMGEVIRALDSASKGVPDALKKALLQEGQLYRNRIVTGIRDQAPGGQAFKPLAETTLASRKLRKFAGTKALLRRGDLRNSVAVLWKEGEGVFVGVLRSAKGREGAPLVNVAEQHEVGGPPILLQITPAIRRFLGAMYALVETPPPRLPAGQAMGFIVHRTPPRPFIRPVWKQLGPPEAVKQRVMARFAKLLNGTLGEATGVATPSE